MLSALQVGVLTAAVSSAMASGMAYVFSTGVMRALGQLPESEAVRAMQAINASVINPLFLGVFMGTGLLAVGLSVANLLGAGETMNPWLLAGTAVFVLGMVGVTVGGNVPLNDALAALNPSALPARAWTAYAHPWLAWNHLRSAASALASALFVLAVMQ